jgi:hypothetical protein
MPKKQNNSPQREIYLKIHRKPSQYDNSYTNEIILMYQVFKEIVEQFTKQETDTANHFNNIDAFIGAYILGDFKINYHEESNEMECTYKMRDPKLIDENINLFFNHLITIPINEDVFASEINKIDGFLKNDPGYYFAENVAAAYNKAAFKIITNFMAMDYINLFLNEEFHECAIYHESNNDFIFDSEFFSFLITQISIFTSFVNCDCKVLKSIIYLFSDDELNKTALYKMFLSIYYYIYSYLEKTDPKITQKVLHSKEIPLLHKFLITLSRGFFITPREDQEKKINFMKLAEKYTENDILREIILLDQYLDSLQWDHALRIVKNIEKMNDGILAIQFVKAIIYYETKLSEAALSLLDMIESKLDAEYPEILLLRAKCLVHQNRIPEGLALLQKIVSRDPEFSPALEFLAYYENDKNNLRQALNYLNAAEKTGNISIKGLLLMSEVFEKLNLSTKETEYLIKAGEKESDVWIDHVDKDYLFSNVKNY